MTTLKSARTLAASLGVLAFGAMAATPAMAFDRVNWNWDKYLLSLELTTAYIKLNVDTTGLVEIEKLQIFLGNLDADSYVYDIHNDPVREVNCYCWWRSVKPIDARYELPIVLSSATAVGNNQSITSDVPVFLHDGQFVGNVRGNSEPGCDWVCSTTAALPADGRFVDGRWQGGNSHTLLALAFLYGAATGYITPAEISAESKVYNIWNASVDSSATAVANNISVNLASDVDGTCTSACGTKTSNHIVIGDITQVAVANVSAESTVYGVHADGYSHMRELTTATLTPTEGNLGNVVQVPTPWISSVATAVGNNVSINVGRNLTTP